MVPQAKQKQASCWLRHSHAVDVGFISREIEKGLLWIQSITLVRVQSHPYRLLKQDLPNGPGQAYKILVCLSQVIFIDRSTWKSFGQSSPFLWASCFISVLILSNASAHLWKRQDNQTLSFGPRTKANAWLWPARLACGRSDFWFMRHSSNAKFSCQAVLFSEHNGILLLYESPYLIKVVLNLWYRLTALILRLLLVGYEWIR